MSTALQHQSAVLSRELEHVLISGDLSKLTPDQRVSFYKATCDSLGLNPLTKPFEYLNLNGKLTLYAKKDCTDQLRDIKNVSVAITSREVVDGCYVVTAKATMPNGRTDESIGAVPLASTPDAKANAMMKAETKARRRVTLSICSLGMLDDSEVETLPMAQRVEFDPPKQITEPAIPVPPVAALDSKLDGEETKIQFLESIQDRASVLQAFRVMHGWMQAYNTTEGLKHFRRILSRHVGQETIAGLKKLDIDKLRAAAGEMWDMVALAQSLKTPRAPEPVDEFAAHMAETEPA